MHPGIYPGVTKPPYITQEIAHPLRGFFQADHPHNQGGTRTRTRAKLQDCEIYRRDLSMDASLDDSPLLREKSASKSARWGGCVFSPVLRTVAKFWYQGTPEYMRYQTHPCRAITNARHAFGRRRGELTGSRSRYTQQASPRTCYYTQAFFLLTVFMFSVRQCEETAIMSTNS